jgi:hypothetical protein
MCTPDRVRHGDVAADRPLREPQRLLRAKLAECEINDE